MRYTKPITELAVNSLNERQLEAHHLDDNFAAQDDAIATITRALFSAGGVAVPGSVTLTGTNLRVQGRVGITLDATAVVRIADETLALATLAAGKGLVIIVPTPTTINRSYTDVVTGETLTDTMNVSLGRLAVLGASEAGVTLDGSGYPVCPANAVPVAQVTRTSSSVTLDTVLAPVPTVNTVAGPAGAPGTPGTNGTNGVSVTGATINGSNHLILTLSDNSTIDAGAVGSTTGNSSGGVIRGNWAANTAYNANDVVLQGGVVYYAKTTFTSGNSFSAANWNAWPDLTGTSGLTIREQDGSPSAVFTTLELPNGTVTDQGGGVARYTPTVSTVSGVNRGAWTASTNYAANDIVSYNGAMYYAKAAFTSGSSFSAANWTAWPDQVGSGGSTLRATVNASPPANPSVGDLWKIPGSYLCTCVSVSPTKWEDATGVDRTPAPTTSYRYYRLNVTANNGADRQGTAELILRTTSGGANIALNKPVLTNGDTSYDAYLTDGITNGGSSFNGTFSTSLPNTLRVDLGTAQIVAEYVVYSYGFNAGADIRSFKDWTFEGSNDGSSWTVLHTVTDQTGWTFGQARTFTL
ncbi:galactose-binding domain-containing protein [Deinococcus radiotolerans]|uniref:Chitin-binding type-3 domain-containing protein n=1 Tax=Deinococcus radiotolerans TaxID=1309407 RepID=A0ABQ2FFJ3_9DEIO|nr:hypothetical protein [Deinococcus radiotolerans]GGK91316.1 hypothetical protein GCM10010844_07280 [Deinococcus radiotolerans]